MKQIPDTRSKRNAGSFSVILAGTTLLLTAVTIWRISITNQHRLILRAIERDEAFYGGETAAIAGYYTHLKNGLTPTTSTSISGTLPLNFAATVYRSMNQISYHWLTTPITATNRTICGQFQPTALRQVPETCIEVTLASALPLPTPSPTPNPTPSPTPTPLACAGYMDQNACWYLGNQGESCDDTCRSHGGVSPAYITSRSQCTLLVGKIVKNDRRVPNQYVYVCANITASACEYDAMVLVGRAGTQPEPHYCGNRPSSSKKQPNVWRMCACNS